VLSPLRTSPLGGAPWPLCDAGGGCALADAAARSHDREDRDVRNGARVREARVLEPDHVLTGEALAELGDEPRLADTRFPDDPDGASLAVHDRRQLGPE